MALISPQVWRRPSMCGTPWPSRPCPSFAVHMLKVSATSTSVPRGSCCCLWEWNLNTPSQCGGGRKVTLFICQSLKPVQLIGKRQMTPRPRCCCWFVPDVVESSLFVWTFEVFSGKSKKNQSVVSAQQWWRRKPFSDRTVQMFVDAGGNASKWPNWVKAANLYQSCFQNCSLKSYSTFS